MADTDIARPDGEQRHDTRQQLRSVQYRDSSNLGKRVSLHDRFSTNRQGFHRWVFDHLSLPPQARVLELGCGRGTLWERNAERIPKDWRVLMSDFTQGMVRDARDVLRKDLDPFTFIVSEAESIPVADDSFDAVIANHMLYHVDRPLVFAEIRRVLKPDGQLYASANGLGHMRELGDLVGEFSSDHRREFGGAQAFGLENGRDQLAEYFDQVDIHRYDDSLVVTDGEALVRWAESWAPEVFAVDQLPDLYAHLSNTTGDNGLHVGKDSGVFIARTGSLDHVAA